MASLQIDPRRLLHYQRVVEQHPHLLKAVLPRLTKYIPHRPTPTQCAFLLLNTRDGLYGGAAGGGKTDALLMGALQYVDVPGYSALLLRRTYGQLNQPQSILDRAHQWLRKTDARWQAEHNRYFFPQSGARLVFGYLQHEADKYQYDSTEYQYIGFDELTQFLKSQYTFLFGRLRRVVGSTIPLRVRGATNPGGVGHLWVKDRYLLNLNPKRRLFIPAKLTDNPHIDQVEYRLALAELDTVTRKQREDGDWDVTAAGNVFKREWFRNENFVDRPPPDAFRVRYWDLAATMDGGDYTVGTLVSKDKSKRYFIEDMQRGQWGPGAVESRILATARADGKQVAIRMEQEPGASGKIVVAQYARLLAGYNFQGTPSTGSKITRWMPMSTQAEHGNLYVVNAPWNVPFFEELFAVPETEHDDQVDSAAGAFNAVSTIQRVEYGISFVGGR